MYPLDKISVPENFLAEYPYDSEIGCDPQKLRDERLAPFPRTEYAIKVNRQEYFAIITHLDAQIGRILDALEATGKTDNTYIFFTADHGLACGHHGLLGKQNMYDHSVRVPLMLAGPNLPAGKRIDHPVYLQDVMPTALEIAGAKIPDHVEFRSLLPQLQPGAKPGRSSIYGAYTHTQRMITKGQYKLIQYPQISQWLLYDLEADPLEANNLADDPAHAATLAELKRELRQLQVQMDDPLMKM
jgi:arylsulfatase A-like enzyme